MAFIGLAHRAGKTLAGSAACEKGVKRGTARLVLLHNALSPSSIGHFQRLCERNRVDVLVLEELGSAIGREEIMVLGITDQSFADQIKNLYGVKGSGGA